MRTFRDTKGDEWTIDISVGTIKRVKDETGVLLPGLFDEQLKPLSELCTDLVLLVAVIYSSVKRQAEQRCLTPDDFAERMGGDSLEQAQEALVRAIADFFPSQASRSFHRLIDLLMETGVTYKQLAADKMTELLSQMDRDQLAQSCLQSVTGGLESAESIPTAEPAAS